MKCIKASIQKWHVTSVLKLSNKASHLVKPDIKGNDKYKLTGWSIASQIAKFYANVTGIYKQLQCIANMCLKPIFPFSKNYILAQPQGRNHNSPINSVSNSSLGSLDDICIRLILCFFRL